MNPTQKKIAVLLSTYNGEKFVFDLLESVLFQSNVDIKIHIRDDGSTDSTPNILSQYSDDQRFKITFGENLGSSRSFYLLLEDAVSQNYPYYAFCDQDDIWLPDKLKIAVECLENSNKNFYSSNRLIVRKKIFKILPPEDHKKVTYASMLFSNSSPGCTQVFDLEFAKKVLAILNGQETYFDWSLSLLAYSMGIAIHDPKSHIYYRIHDDNQIGVSGFLDFLIKPGLILSKLKSINEQIVQHRQAASKSFDTKAQCLWDALEGIEGVGFVRKIKSVFFLPRLSTSRLRNFFFKILIILNFFQLRSVD